MGKEKMLKYYEMRLRYADQKPAIIIFSSMYRGWLMQEYWAYSCRVHFAGPGRAKRDMVLRRARRRKNRPSARGAK